MRTSRSVRCASCARLVSRSRRWPGIYGAKGLAYIKVNDVTKASDEGLQSPIVKFFKADELRTILERCGAATGIPVVR